MSARILQLVPKRVIPPKHLVETLQILEEGARHGTVTGVAYLAILETGKYTVSWVGSADQHPTLVVGGLMQLVSRLGDLIDDRDQDDVR